MKLGLLILILIQTIMSASDDFIYTIRYLKSYDRLKVSNFMGCQYKNIVYGNYIYPQGPVDALYVYLNPNMYNFYITCSNNVFAKIFGTAQDYELLFKADPKILANNILKSINADNYIIDWKYSPEKDFRKGKNWLKQFIQASINLNLNKDIYVKAPASYFCYEKDGQKYLLSLNKGIKLIIEMHGQEVGRYTNYQQIFKNERQEQNDEKQRYSDKCHKYPSYNSLKNNYSDKQFYIQKTILKEQAGYIGEDKLRQYLQRANKQNIYNKLMFVDSYKPQIIQL